MPAPKRAQSEGATGRYNRPAPPFVPGVSYSVEELDNASEEQRIRNERARKNFLDRSLRDARPSPPTATSPFTPVAEIQVVNAAVPVTTIPSDTTAAAQTSAVSHTEAANTEPPPSTAP
eukprot:4212089-Amphidinium_carterae.1